MAKEAPDIETLTRILQATLPHARLEVRALDLCPAVRLHLISPDNMDRAFSPDEVRSILGTTPYWAFCWAAGHALAAFLLTRRRIAQGKRVLDVGTGSGVAAVAAAMAGAKEVVACDTDEKALEAVRANARLNDVKVATCRSLEEVNGTVDLLLASDLFYDLENRPLLATFPHMAREVLIADARVSVAQSGPYRKFFEMQAETLPDLKEPGGFNRVGFYLAGTAPP
jgi:predicted nicotinamide N-methyase